MPLAVHSDLAPQPVDSVEGQPGGFGRP
jgi:hypothetical protein